MDWADINQFNFLNPKLDRHFIDSSNRWKGRLALLIDYSFLFIFVGNDNRSIFKYLAAGYKVRAVMATNHIANFFIEMFFNLVSSHFSAAVIIGSVAITPLGETKNTDA